MSATNGDFARRFPDAIREANLIVNNQEAEELRHAGSLAAKLRLDEAELLTIIVEYQATHRSARVGDRLHEILFLDQEISVVDETEREEGEEE
jgi:hypothetical protein